MDIGYSQEMPPPTLPPSSYPSSSSCRPRKRQKMVCYVLVPPGSGRGPSFPEKSSSNGGRTLRPRISTRKTVDGSGESSSEEGYRDILDEEEGPSYGSDEGSYGDSDSDDDFDPEMDPDPGQAPPDPKERKRKYTQMKRREKLHPSVEDETVLTAANGFVECRCNGHNGSAEEFTPEGTCKVLDALQLRFHSPSGYLICAQHPMTISGKGLGGHITGQHQSRFPALKGRKYIISCMVKHVLKAFGISRDQETEKEIALNLNLNLPVPSIEVVAGFKCRHCYRAWAVHKSILNHSRPTHGVLPPSQHNAFVQKINRVYHVVRSRPPPNAVEAAAARTASHSTASSSIADFLRRDELGMGPGRNLNESAEWTQANGWWERVKGIKEAWATENEGGPFEGLIGLVDTSYDLEEWRANKKLSLSGDADAEGRSAEQEDEDEGGDEAEDDEQDEDDDESEGEDEGARATEEQVQERKERAHEKKERAQKEKERQRRLKEDQKRKIKRHREATKNRKKDDEDILSDKIVSAARFSMVAFAKNSNAFLDSCTSSTRALITKNHPHSVYRVIKEEAYKGYARSFVAVVALLLRFRRASPALQKCVSMRITPSQSKARDALEDYAQSLPKDATVRSSTFDALLFQFLRTLLEEEIPLERKMDTPMELARLFSNLMDDGGIKDASTVTQILSGYQFMLRMVGIHAARLAFENKTAYEEWLPPDTLVGGEVVQALAGDGEPKLHECINNGLKWLSPPQRGLGGMGSTTYSRVISEWVSAGKASRRMTSSAVTNWEENETVISFLRPGKAVKRIRLDDFPEMARETSDDLVKQVEDMLPSGWQEVLGGFLDTNFVDDTTLDQPFLYQPPNIEGVHKVQKPMIEHYKSDTDKHQLFKNGNINDAGFTKFKEKNQLLLQALVSHFIVTATVPPREAAIKSYRWYGCKKEHRHLLMVQGRLVLAWGPEKAENMRGRRVGAIYPFSPGAQRAVILYFAFVRKIHLYILEKILKIDPGLLTCAIFVRSYHVNPFRTKDINGALRSVTQKYLGEEFSIMDFRQITSAVFFVHFPDQVLQPPTEGENERAVNASANHTSSTGFQHYGRGNTTSRWISSKNTTYTFLLSDAYLAFLTLIEVKFCWPKPIKESRLLAPRFSMRKAIEAAKYMLPAAYGFSREVDSGSRKKNQQILADLEDANPFLGEKPKKGFPAVLGDEVLLRVMDAVVWGNRPSRPSRFPEESDGSMLLRPQDAAVAVRVIIKAAKAFAYGEVSIDSGPSPGDMQNEKSSLALFQYVKATHPDLWASFSERVRYLPPLRVDVAPEHNDDPWSFPKTSWCDPIPEGSPADQLPEENPLLTLLRAVRGDGNLTAEEQTRNCSLLEENGVTLAGLKNFSYSVPDLQNFTKLGTIFCQELIRRSMETL